MDPGRIFNVDERAFQSHKKTKSAVAVRGSSNVLKTEMSTSFHISHILLEVVDMADELEIML
ncbi:hypothetical protein PHMEG_00028888, partial [Phytophthora megakarya]